MLQLGIKQASAFLYKASFTLPWCNGNCGFSPAVGLPSAKVLEPEAGVRRGLWLVTSHGNLD